MDALYDTWSVSIMQARKLQVRDFPGGAVVRTPSLHCRGHRFNSPSGNWDSTCRTAQLKKRKLQVKKTRAGEMKVQRQDWAWFWAEETLELGKEYMRAHTCLSTLHKKTVNKYMYVYGRSNLPGRVLIPGSWMMNLWSKIFLLKYRFFTEVQLI